MLNPLRSRRVARLLLLALALLALSATVALAATSTVVLKDSRFVTKSLSISRGSTITWVWKGSLFHNVKVKSGPARFASRTQIHGTYSHRFTARGTYKLFCSLHPYMTMTVVVR